MRFADFFPRPELAEYVRLGLLYRGDLCDNTYHTKDECVHRMRSVFAWRAANEYMSSENSGQWNCVYEMTVNNTFETVLAFARLRKPERARICTSYLKLNIYKRREFSLWHAIAEVKHLKI